MTISFCYLIARDEDLDPGAYPDDAADARPIDEDRETIEIEFGYPLSRPTRRAFARPDGGWTRAALAAAVARGYRDIYREEAESMTTLIPNRALLNRGRSNGIHGIWGHGIGDLILESAERGADGVWRLGVGS